MKSDEIILKKLKNIKTKHLKMVNWLSHDFGRTSKIFNIDHYKVKP